MFSPFCVWFYLHYGIIKFGEKKRKRASRQLPTVVSTETYAGYISIAIDIN